MYSTGMRSAGLGLLALVCTLSLGLQPTAAEDHGVFGYWKRVDEETGKIESIFRLWEDKGKLIGKIVKTFPRKGKPAQLTCSECSGAQKDKPVNGLIFMWGFNRDQEKPTKWVDGHVLNPEDGKTYNCEVELDEDGKTLNVYGYIRMLVKLGGTSKWQRATPEELRGL